MYGAKCRPLVPAVSPAVGLPGQACPPRVMVRISWGQRGDGRQCRRRNPPGEPPPQPQGRFSGQSRYSARLFLKMHARQKRKGGIGEEGAGLGLGTRESGFVPYLLECTCLVLWAPKFLLFSSWLVRPLAPCPLILCGVWKDMQTHPWSQDKLHGNIQCTLNQKPKETNVFSSHPKAQNMIIELFGSTKKHSRCMFFSLTKTGVSGLTIFSENKCPN